MSPLFPCLYGSGAHMSSLTYPNLHHGRTARSGCSWRRRRRMLRPLLDLASPDLVAPAADRARSSRLRSLWQLPNLPPAPPDLAELACTAPSPPALPPSTPRASGRRPRARPELATPALEELASGLPAWPAWPELAAASGLAGWPELAAVSGLAGAGRRIGPGQRWHPSQRQCWEKKKQMINKRK
jgi:hypothetical protein